MEVPKGIVPRVQSVNTKTAKVKDRAKNVASTPTQKNQVNLPMPIAPPAMPIVPRVPSPATPILPPVFAKKPSSIKAKTTNVNRAQLAPRAAPTASNCLNWVPNRGTGEAARTPLYLKIVVPPY